MPYSTAGSRLPALGSRLSALMVVGCRRAALAFPFSAPGFRRLVPQTRAGGHFGEVASAIVAEQPGEGTGAGTCGRRR